ncbi:RNA recognition motif domain-containing protein [Psychromonas antarctica]|jgi:RNA recognition motif-containing protein|uniref:RNA recognition motif domain-containing protein n=1 Tax=Psychromonas antarctica TaxID=67573 RepID=UPI001EE92BD1|nr:RNA-binding protein [Psychromonas antarctica]MCG6200410.1 RNA-binding protein [Psychromonas antarctica]
MKSNTSVLLSIAIAILGYIIIRVSGVQISGALLFAIGALASGVAIQFIRLDKSTNSDSEASEGDFTSTTLYVGNLPYRANEMSIRTLFSEHGKVLSVRLMKDKHTGKRRGFGFVEMPQKDAENAINALNEQEFQERSLKVREANERTPRNEQNEEA